LSATNDASELEGTNNLDKASHMAEIKTKQSFSGVTIAHISPPVGPAVPKSMNVHLTFEEALKLHFGLGQLLAKLNIPPLQHGAFSASHGAMKGG
jgi:hypothetical protein